MSAVAARPASARGGVSALGPDGIGRRLLGSPFWLSVAACVVLAALSAAVLPTVPSYDPWSWISWGREVTDPGLSFAVGGGPSWKPLPVLFTTVWGLFGSVAPTLWVITARAGGLLGLVAAYRLAARLVGGDSGLWGVAAGVLAALAVVLTQDWVYYMFRGTSEPMLIGASLWAIDRHLAGRRGGAFWLGVAAALIRPEAWPFLLGYAIWLWFRDPPLRAWLVLGLLAIPFFWFVPPWIGSGQPFLAASHAKAYNGHLGSDRFVTVVRRGADLQTVPVLILGVLAVVLAWFRGRDRVALTLAGFACLWWVIVVAMTLDGYPGLERFYLPAAAVICVLAGAGVVFMGRLAAAWLRPASAARAAVGGVVAVVLVALSVPFLTRRISVARAQEPIAARAVTRLHQLSLAVAAVGGHHGVYPCRSSFAAINHGVQTALAWKLHVTLGRVGTEMRHQGVLFAGPHDTIDGAAAPLAHRLTQVRLLRMVGAWRVYRVTAPGAHTGCVGR
jgi:hypothetical protein